MRGERRETGARNRRGLDLDHAGPADSDDHVPLLSEKDMIQNVGTVDRVIRIVAGAALIAASVLGYIGAWGWIGIVPLATGLVRVCPAYLPFGLSTCSAPSANTKP
jgi:hypothetical protein